MSCVRKGRGHQATGKREQVVRNRVLRLRAEDPRWPGVLGSQQEPPREGGRQLWDRKNQKPGSDPQCTNCSSRCLWGVTSPPGTSVFPSIIGARNTIHLREHAEDQMMSRVCECPAHCKGPDWPTRHPSRGPPQNGIS